MPIDRATLDRQLAQLTDSARWVGRPEVDELPAILNQGERVLAATTAWLVESGKLAVRTWVVLVTTERLICVLKGGSTSKDGTTGSKKVELAVVAMKSAHTDARLGYHEVIIEQIDGGKMIISGLPKDSAVWLATALASQITAHHEPVPMPLPVAIPEPPASFSPVPAAEAPSEAYSPGVADITLGDLAGLVEKVQQLEANRLEIEKRLAAMEEVIRRAAARPQTPNPTR